jgi:lipopolysaccharide heptosyltransferase II
MTSSRALIVSFDGPTVRKLLLYRHYLAGFLIPLLIRLQTARLKAPQIDLRDIKRIAIIRCEPRIGDFILMSAFLREIRELFPQAEIHLVVCSPTRPLAERCPYVDRIIIFDCSRGIPLLCHSMQAWRAFRLARRELRPTGFDLAIIPRWDVDSYGATALAYFSRARWRLAFSENVNRNKALVNHCFDFLATHVIDDRDVCHEAERSLQLLRFLGATISDSYLEVWTDAVDERFAEDILHQYKIERDRAVIAIAPGASEAKRRWPASRFAELARRLQARFKAIVLLVGDQHDRELAGEISETLRDGVVNLVGQTTLRQTAALLRRSSMFVGNCSGPLHLAAAAGVAVVEISCHPRYGSESHDNSPARFGPWQVPQVVLQPERATSPCTEACEANMPHCILSVSIEQVTEAALRLLETTKLRVLDTGNRS